MVQFKGCLCYLQQDTDQCVRNLERNRGKEAEKGRQHVSDLEYEEELGDRYLPHGN